MHDDPRILHRGCIASRQAAFLTVLVAISRFASGESAGSRQDLFPRKAGGGLLRNSARDVLFRTVVRSVRDEVVTFCAFGALDIDRGDLATPG